MAEEKGSMQQVKAGLAEKKQTILLYSPDLNFCFSLSVLFQDRFNVVTTTNLAMVQSFIGSYSASLVMLDAVPAQSLVERVDAIKQTAGEIPIILMYVYNARDAEFDRQIREKVDSVFYKPFEIGEISRRISELLDS